MITLSWVKCVENVWCSLERLDLDNVTANGVYIIWHSGNPGRVVRVGQGNIAERLKAHRTDQSILAYKKNGQLYVTWAAVPVHHLDGVEAYLALQWNPLVGDRYPYAVPLAVNSPWS
jgi:hypothetical protein